MLYTYFDDSSDPRHEKYFAAGGLIGSEPQWDFFDALWSGAVRGLESPFRSTECECNHGQFEQWSKQQCNELMDKLVSILLESKLMGFASVVPVAEYKRIFPQSPAHGPYFLAVGHTIVNMATIGYWSQTNVSLCFEDSQTTSAGVRKLYWAFKNQKSWVPSAYVQIF
jgi:hypothetical protein